MPSPLMGHLEQTSDQSLSLRLDDGQSLKLSPEQVYGPVISGSPVRLFIVSQSSDGIGDSALSRAMINELLHPPTP